MTVRVAERCKFSLDELRYEYPEELVPTGETPSSHLRKLTEKGLRWRFPNGAPEEIRKLIEHELALIAELKYEPFFLTVYDVVEFARAKKILCQGRGSAANSAVCYALGITEIDPARMNGLFERFVSKERHEPPDIDVDFEHDRREEVIQYVYGKYGRGHPHHLPAEERAARCRQGARSRSGSGRPAGEEPRLVGRQELASPAHSRGGGRSRAPHNPADDQACPPPPPLSPASVPPSRRRPHL